MVAIANSEIDAVLSRVAQWPATDRVVLARRILETIEPRPLSKARGYSAEEVIAQLKMPQPAPSDADCNRILAEELLRKYGQ